MSSETQIRQLEDVCAERGITLGARLVRKPLVWDVRHDDKRDWRETAFQWYVTLAYQGREMQSDYWCGQAHATWKGKPLPRSNRGLPGWMSLDSIRKECTPTPPSVADVVYSMCADASALDMPFAEWAAEYGYSDDSIKARDIYFACQEQAIKARRVLGDAWEACRNAEH